MPRVNGVMQLPPGTYGVSGTTVQSAKYNTFADDVVADLNAPRPVTAGGTGANSAVGARANLGVYSKTEVDATTTRVAALEAATSEVSFAADRNGVDQVIGAATNTKVLFQTERFDYGSNFDAPNARWTPPAGRYIVMIGLDFTGGLTVGGTIAVSLYANNNTLFSAISVASSATRHGGQLTCLITTDGTVYYDVFAFAGGSGSKTIDGSITSTYWHAARVA